MTERAEATAADAGPVEELSFEEALSELQQIVLQLQDEAVGLERSFSLWERGQLLYRHCEKRLAEITAKLDEVAPRPDSP